MFRAVFDSNVYISALCFSEDSPPAQAYILAIEGRFELWTSAAIILETTDKLQSKFRWESRKLKQLVKQIGRIAKIAQPEKALRIVKADPTDDRILECAQSAEAHFIVTGDKHLLTLGRYNNIIIVTPATFVGLIRKG